MADRIAGIVMWFNAAKGFGFIARRDGGTLFVRFSKLRDSCHGFRTLKDSDWVEFTPRTSPKDPGATKIVKN